MPVRGQIARLIPQPEVRYGLVYRSVLTVPRRDGLVVQSFAAGETQGYGDNNETPDRAEAERPCGRWPSCSRRAPDARQLNARLDFLLHLKAIGREVADRWIGHHFDAIGQRSTIDVKEMFL